MAGFILNFLCPSFHRVPGQLGLQAPLEATCSPRATSLRVSQGHPLICFFCDPAATHSLCSHRACGNHTEGWLRDWTQQGDGKGLSERSELCPQTPRRGWGPFHGLDGPAGTSLSPESHPGSSRGRVLPARGDSGFPMEKQEFST